MKQFSKILKFELKGYFKNKVFIGITLFLVVLIAVGTFIPSLISMIKPDGSDSTPGTDPTTPTADKTMLILSKDESITSVVKEYFTAAFPSYNVRIFDTGVDELKEEVMSGNADCGFVIDSSTSFTYYVNNLSLYDTNAASAGALMQEVYRINEMIKNGLTPEEAAEIMSVSITSNTETLGKNQITNFIYTYVMILALYTVILMYGQMVATNVATEKSSRAMELLVTSADPVSMMFGKVVSSCLAGLMQLTAIFGSAIIFYNINKASFEGNQILDSIFNIPPQLLVFMLVFFILGFLIYAFLYGAIGSMASKLEDINTLVLPVTFLFLIAFFIVIFSMGSSNVDNILMKVASYVPFTSPMAMFTRIAMGSVAWYEIMISIIILIGSVIGVGILCAKIYRAGVLLYGNSPKFSSVVKALLKKS